MFPAHTKAALDRYVEHKILPGGFLMAVLSNDLFEAVGRADSENIVALPDIVQYIYCQMPADCWGSKEQIYKFVEDAFYNRVKEAV
jgi:hypothetical protein